MYRVWLKDNWKDLFNHETDIVVVDEELIRKDVQEALRKYGLTSSDSIFEKILAIMQITGEDAETTVKSILNIT